MERLRRTNLQRLLRLETEENVLALRKYWERVLKSNESWLDKEGGFRYGLLSKVISENPYPVVSTVVWNANLSELPAYLDYGKIERLWIFYQRVERLKAIYDFLCEANAERKANIQNERMQNGVGAEHIFTGWEFADMVHAHSEKFKSLMENVLEFHINA